MNSIIRFAIIGAGHIGKRHAEKVTNHPEAEVIAIVDPKDRQETLGELYQSTPYFHSVDELLSSGLSFDIASICIPNGLHFDETMKIIQSGHSALVEKPMVLHTEQGKSLQEEAEKQGVQLFGVLQNRYTPASAWFKSILGQGLLGTLFDISLECHWNRDERYYRPGSWHGDKDLDGGTLFTQYSHFVDLLIWLFGYPEVRSTRFENFNHQQTIDFEDSGSVELEFPNHVHGSLRYSTAVFGTNRGIRLTVLGSKGCVVLDGPFMNEVVHCEIEDYKMPQLAQSNQGNQYGGYSGSAQNHHIVIEEVVKKMQGKEGQVVTADEALDVVALIRSIYDQNPYFNDQNHERP